LELAANLKVNNSQPSNV